MRQTVHYSTIRQLMAKHGLQPADISKIINKSYRQTTLKLNKSKSKTGKVATFDIVEANQLLDYFVGLGEDVDFAMLFFDKVVTKVTS